MNSLLRGWNGLGQSIAALLIIILLPIEVGAATLGFRNDTESAVIVQGISIVNQVIRRGPPHVLQPGQVAGDVIVAPGNKLIIIADAKQPTRILFRDTVQCGATDLFFSIQAADTADKSDAPAKPKGTKVAPAKVKLVPAKQPGTIPIAPGTRR